MNSVLTGLDVLVEDRLPELKSSRVGLLTNASSATRDLKSNVDALRGANIDIVALFAPEHGISGDIDHGNRVETLSDYRTGLPVYSLYGDTYRPTRDMLEGIDILIYDIQDVGARFYTYIVTLAFALEACAECKKRILVLDKPNPISGLIVEGPILDPTLQTMVGHGPLPIRFGLTPGELANFYNRELGIDAELEVVKLRGWLRSMWFDETELQWVPPSPNIPHLTSAIVYPGICLLEGTNLSVGRGTPLPFEIVGAPFIDGHALADSLNTLHLEGVKFRAISFTPGSDALANERCSGVQIHVTDRLAFRPVTMALHLISTVRRQCGEKFAWGAGFDRLVGDRSVRTKIDQGMNVDQIVNEWASDLEAFEERCRPYLMYA
jgi:uncharacterized protein YbbC (DUF1343 family)